MGFFRGMGFEPVHLCGKPDEWAVRAALAQWGIDDPSQCLFVGDNLRTDIAAAVGVGARSALVLSGVSTVEDVAASPVEATAVLESVAALNWRQLEEIALRRTPQVGPGAISLGRK